MATADEKDPGFPPPPDEEDYEHLIEDYSHLAPPSEGEVLQGHVVKVTHTEAIVDVGLKLEGCGSHRAVAATRRHDRGKSGRHDRRRHGSARPSARRIHPSFLFPSEPPAHLGHAGSSHARPVTGLGARPRTHQRWTDRGCRRDSLYAGLASGRASHSRSRSIRRPGYSG